MHICIKKKGKREKMKEEKKKGKRKGKSRKLPVCFGSCFAFLVSGWVGKAAWAQDARWT